MLSKRSLYVWLSYLIEAGCFGAVVVVWWSVVAGYVRSDDDIGMVE